MTEPHDFSTRAATWDENPRVVAQATDFARAIAEEVALRPDMTAMEFGCGTGLVTMQLAGSLDNIWMVDLAAGMLDVVRAKMAAGDVTNLRLHHGHLHEIPAADGSLDLAYTLMALHHVPDITDVIGHFARLLAPGGRLCIGDLEPEDGSFHGGIDGVHHGFEAEHLANALAAAGLRVTTHRRMCVVTKQDSHGTPRQYPVFFLAAHRD